MKYLAALLPFLWCASVSAQQLLTQPTLRADVELEEAEPAFSNAVLVASTETHAVFYSSGWNGRGLWVTDGTTAGTHLIEETLGGLKVEGSSGSSEILPYGVALGDGTFFVIAEVGLSLIHI